MTPGCSFLRLPWLLAITAAFLSINSLSAPPDLFAQAKFAAEASSIEFSGYSGGAVDKWLETRKFRFEKDARDRRLLELSISDGVLTLEEKGRLTGFILNDSLNIGNVKSIRIEWGIKKYPEEVSYENRVNNEALMIYIFFGSERISSGHILIPSSPYFIGLFLCQHERINLPYKGRYFHEGGRFVCLGKPKPGQMISSEFDLAHAYKSYFGKEKVPPISGIALGVDTSIAAGGGTGGAFVKRIQFIHGPAQ